MGVIKLYEWSLQKHIHASIHTVRMDPTLFFAKLGSVFVFVGLDN